MEGEIEAGRMMDALVAVAIFGGTCARCQKQPAPHVELDVTYCSPDCAQRIGDYALDDYEQHSPRYSTDIAAAWKVVEKLNADYTKVAVTNRIRKWACSIIVHAGTPQEAQFFEYGETAPEAICKAALASVKSLRNGNSQPSTND